MSTVWGKSALNDKLKFLLDKSEGAKRLSLSRSCWLHGRFFGFARWMGRVGFLRRVWLMLCASLSLHGTPNRLMAMIDLCLSSNQLHEMTGSSFRTP